jgi:hypothetical protein
MILIDPPRSRPLHKTRHPGSACTGGGHHRPFGIIEILFAERSVVLAAADSVNAWRRINAASAAIPPPPMADGGV